MSTLSVAMCTYNGAAYLREQLESIGRQHRQPDELVIVDDHSNDESVAIIRRFEAEARFPVRLHVNSENIGSTKNFELAITLCKGDVVALADQDDVWYPEKLAVVEETFASQPGIGAVFSGANIVDRQLNDLGYRLWDVIGFADAEKRRVSEGDLFDVLLKRNVVTGATMAFKREYVQRFTPMPAIWVHDGWIALILSTLTRVVAVDKPLIMYRQHEENQIGASKMSMRDKINKAKTTTSIYYDLVKQYESGRDFLSLEPGCDWAVVMLEEKVKHLSKRAELAKRQKWERLPSIVEEVVKFRYHRYSNGWRSVARDLVLV